MYKNNRYLRQRNAGAYTAGGTDVTPVFTDQSGKDRDGMVLAMAYVKDQKFGKIYDDDEALMRGTLFPSLYFPYEGGR